MKMKEFKIMLTLLMSLISINVMAYDIAVKNADGVTIYYNYSEDGTELIVTNSHFYYQYFYDAAYRGDVVIPEEVSYMNRTRKVTCIGDSAFCDCSDLTSVTIPNSVTTIGNSAFKECNSLTSVTIPNSVTTIGGSAFLYCSSLTSLTIGDSITSIGKHAFYKSGLYSINVTVTDYATFCNNKAVGLINMTVLLIDDKGNEIKNFVVPNNVTSIGDKAFRNCSGLTSVTIGNSVTSIGEYAFFGCSGLTSVTIPNSVTAIEVSAFRGCSGLTSVTIGNSVTSIGEYAFCGCSSLTSIDIPNSVTTIEMAAFWKSGLTNVIIPNSVTTIGGSAFESCSGLTSVTIGSGVKSIGNYAFSKDENIVTVNSLIEEPFAIEGKSSSSSVFHGDTYIYGKLKVPFGTKDKYKATKGWRDFDTIEEGVDVEIPGAEKCATPTISYNKGELTFSCDTEGATCKYTITDADIQSGSGNKVQLSVAYQVSVVAMKDGYNNSEAAEATLCWVDVQPQTEGVEVATAVQSIEAQPVLIQANGQVVRITGAPEGSAIAIYDTSGQLMGSGKATAGTTDISTHLNNGDIAIVKIGDRAVKVVVR